MYCNFLISSLVYAAYKSYRPNSSSKFLISGVMKYGLIVSLIKCGMTKHVNTIAKVNTT